MSRYRVAMSALMCAGVALVAVGTDALRAQTSTSVTATFHRDVLPILQKNCQNCHRPGQIAPMSFLTYDATRPWARAIKNAVVSKKMPPWFADAAYGHFTNERSLKPRDLETLVAWADSGAPAGDPKDAPPPIEWPENGWQIKPDLIVEGPHYDVPEKGIVEWTWFVVPSGLTKDTWVTSIEVKPSEPAVTHHICLTYIPHEPDVKYFTAIPKVVERDANGNEIRRVPPQFQTAPQSPPPAQGGPQRGASGASFAGGLPPVNSVFGILSRGNGIEECYEPGRNPADFRAYGAAKLIPAGTDIALNVHYTPNGKTVTDHVQIGFTLAKETPKRRYLAMSTSSPSDPQRFAIPPNNADWEAPAAMVTFERDVELVGLMPHMHVRGKSAIFYLDYPDGRKETILSVPRYDFNWQLWYDTSLRVPKGTTMRVVARYDNSVQNKFNPNPNATVYYGDQTWEEMHFPSYGVVVDDLKVNQRDVVKQVLGGGAAPPARPAGN